MEAKCLLPTTKVLKFWLGAEGKLDVSGGARRRKEPSAKKDLGGGEGLNPNLSRV